MFLKWFDFRDVFAKSFESFVGNVFGWIFDNFIILVLYYKYSLLQFALHNTHINIHTCK